MKELKIVTVSTHIPREWYYTYKQWWLTCNMYQPIILDNNFHPYSGLGSKPKMLHKAIKTGLINTSHVLFMDSWDTFFARSPQILFEKYFEFNSPIVISAEKNCFPADLKKEYDELNPPTSYKYLNSGMIIGETGALEAALEAMDLKSVPEDYWDAEKGCNVHINDQELWQHLFLKQPVAMKLDYHQILCQTLHDVKISELDLSGSEIINKETGYAPCLFHANGSAKDSGVKEPILKHLKL